MRTEQDPVGTPGTPQMPPPENPELGVVELGEEFRKADFSEQQTVVILKTMQQFRCGLATQAYVDASIKSTQHAIEARIAKSEHAIEARIAKSGHANEVRFERLESTIGINRQAAATDTKQLGADLRADMAEFKLDITNALVSIEKRMQGIETDLAKQTAELHRSHKNMVFAILGGVLALLALVEFFVK